MVRSRKKRGGIVLFAVTVAVLLMAGTGIFLYGQFGETNDKKFEGTFVQREEVQREERQESGVRLADVQPGAYPNDRRSVTEQSAGACSNGSRSMTEQSADTRAYAAANLEAAV